MTCTCTQLCGVGETVLHPCTSVHSGPMVEPSGMDVAALSGCKALTQRDQRRLCHPFSGNPVFKIALRFARFPPWPSPISLSMSLCQEFLDTSQVQLQLVWGEAPRRGILAPFLNCLVGTIIGSACSLFLCHPMHFFWNMQGYR